MSLARWFFYYKAHIDTKINLNIVRIIWQTHTHTYYQAQKIKNNLLALICDRCHSGFSGEFKTNFRQTNNFHYCIAYNYDVDFKSIVTETNEFSGSSSSASAFLAERSCEWRNNRRMVNPHKNRKLIIITLINQIFPFAWNSIKKNKKNLLPPNSLGFEHGNVFIIKIICPFFDYFILMSKYLVKAKRTQSE